MNETQKLNSLSDFAKCRLHFPFLHPKKREEMVSLYCSECSELNNDVDADIGNRVLEAYKGFKIEGSIHSVEVGPVVMRVNFVPAPDVTNERVANKASDLARLLRVESVCITPNNPVGAMAIDIPFPSRMRKNVLPGNLLGIDHSDNVLPIDLGVDVVGRGACVDLCKAPHMLVAGTTGSGKSAFVNAIIASLLRNVSETEYSLMLIDPKGVELACFRDLPHVVNKKILDKSDEILQGLDWLHREMDRRYDLLTNVGVKDIKKFNKKIISGDKAFYSKVGIADLHRMRYIVCIIDEFADLVLNNEKIQKREFERHVQSLAQKGRAAGIHLILATQTPRSDVISGVIKANIPMKVAFRVSNAVDSRVILGEDGAESLLGAGDMLVDYSGWGGLKRLHGAWYDGPFKNDDETVIEKMVAFIKSNSFDMQNEIVSFDTGTRNKSIAAKIPEGFFTASFEGVLPLAEYIDDKLSAGGHLVSLAYKKMGNVANAIKKFGSGWDESAIYELAHGDVIHLINGKDCTINKKCKSEKECDIYDVVCENGSCILRWFVGTPAPFKKGNLQNLVKVSLPSNFVRPIAIAGFQKNGFGYLISAKSFSSCVRLEAASLNAQSFLNVCLQIASCFKDMHLWGLCFSDYNESDILINSSNGSVVIDACENVVRIGDVRGDAVQGKFLAPELVDGTHAPDRFTDYYLLGHILSDLRIRMKITVPLSAILEDAFAKSLSPEMDKRRELRIKDVEWIDMLMNFKIKNPQD